MTFLDRVLLLRAEEQTAGARLPRALPREAREEKKPAPYLCAVPGCSGELPAWSGSPMFRPLLCAECKARKMAATPCKACGGPLRRLDQTAVRKHRRGICQRCRSELPGKQPKGWAKGQSGNPTGKMRGHSPRATP